MRRAPSLAGAIAGWFKSLENNDRTWRDRHVSGDPPSLRPNGPPALERRLPQAGRRMETDPAACRLRRAPDAEAFGDSVAFPAAG